MELATLVERWCTVRRRLADAALVLCVRYGLDPNVAAAYRSGSTDDLESIHAAFLEQLEQVTREETVTRGSVCTIDPS
jgi:hypothetical protein